MKSSSSRQSIAHRPSAAFGLLGKKEAKAAEGRCAMLWRLDELFTDGGVA